MEGAVDEEVPHAERALVAVGVDAVRVDELVGDQLVDVARLKDLNSICFLKYWSSITLTPRK